MAKQNDIDRHEIELNRCKDELLNKKSEYNKHREELLRSLDEYSVLKTRIVGFEQELRELNSRIQRVNDEKNDLYKNSVLTRCQLNTSYETLRKVVSEAMSLITKNREISSEIENVTKSKTITDTEIRKREEELSQTNSRLNVLKKIQNNYEWLPQELSKFIIDHKGREIIGILADFITVPEEYETALEASLGEKLNWSLVNDLDSAESLIRELENLDLGRGTFYPVKNTAVRVSRSTSNEGLLALNDVIVVNDIDKQIISNILEKIYITNSLADVTDLEDRLSEGYSFVTPLGNYIDSSGYVSGGHFSNSVFERKREIEELAANSKRLYDDINASKSELSDINKVLSNLHSESSSSGMKLKQLEIYEAEIRKDIDNLNDRCDRYLERVKVVGFELSGYESDKSNKADMLNSISRDITIVENKKHHLEGGFRDLEA